MNSLILFAGEGLLTNFADVRLLAGVQAEVRGQRFVLLEGHAADVARERVVLQVTIGMVLLFHLSKAFELNKKFHKQSVWQTYSVK